MKHNTIYYLLLCWLCFCNACVVKVDNHDNPNNTTNPDPELKNANTVANVFTGYFLYGSNMGWLNNNWRDEDVADILVGNTSKNREGVGVISLRPALYEFYVEQWGYDVRVETFKYYANIGAKENVVFIGDSPCDEHRESKQYVSGVPSESFENLYEPIWVSSDSKTTVNENNYYAVYVYKVVQRYKGQVKFWEIKNEPDLTGDWYHAEAAPGIAGNWWQNDPPPGDLNNWHAPIQSYIRLLRISYEVIKFVDPEAFVCVGGIGYASFLDAILRNTDNPDNGKVTEEYQFKGGAWFDCLSYHCYPMYYVAPGNSYGLARHSDAAVAALMLRQGGLEDVLKKHGYGSDYPTKEIIVTETNISGKQVGNSIGSPEVQRNYLLKAAIIGQKNRISGIYVYGPWDNKEQSATGGDYDYMGLYKPLPNTPSGIVRFNESGIAWRTVSQTLKARRYSQVETAKLALPANIEGAAFHSTQTNDYIYALWAKTAIDLSESASAAYTFPAAIIGVRLNVTSWNGNSSVVNGRTITLSGSPVFIKINE